jgi:hypothetical protein
MVRVKEGFDKDLPVAEYPSNHFIQFSREPFSRENFISEGQDINGHAGPMFKIWPGVGSTCVDWFGKRTVDVETVETGIQGFQDRTHVSSRGKFPEWGCENLVRRGIFLDVVLTVIRHE